MKKITYIALSMALALGFSACTDEAEYTPAGQVAEDCPRVSFVADGDVEEVAPGETTTQLVLMRENTAGELTVPLNVLQNDDNVFQIPESVTFADGENVAVANVTFSNLEIAVVYTYSVSVDEQYVDPYAETTLASSTRSVQMIQWDLLGEGSLTNSVLYQGVVTAPCNIYRASHAHWYKAEAPFEEGRDIVFQVNDDDNSVVVADQAIITHPSYGLVYVNNEDEGGVYDPETNTIRAGLYYYCSAGYFGTEIETLTIPAE